MNGYELMVLFGPDEAKEAKITKIKKIIEDADGKVEDVSDWGVKDLSYPIKKFSKAYYLLFTCQIPPKGVLDVDKAVRISEDIIRYIIVKKEPGRVKDLKGQPLSPAKPDSTSQSKKVETKKISKVKKTKKASSAKGSGGLEEETKEGKSK